MKDKVLKVMQTVLLLLDGVSQFKLLTDYSIDAKVVILAKEILIRIEYAE